MIGLRALDYERAIGKHVRIGGFFGAASVDTGKPQTGYYMGLNASYRMLNDRLGLVFEIKHGNGLARDRIEGDPPPSVEDRPDVFMDFVSTGLKLSWTF